MLLIKVKTEADEIITRINGTLEEIARYYSPRKEVKEIEILDGAESEETEFYKKTPTMLYRATDEEIRTFDLFYNIRQCYKIEYKPEYKAKYSDYCASFGFVNV